MFNFGKKIKCEEDKEEEEVDKPKNNNEHFKDYYHFNDDNIFIIPEQ